MVKWKLLTINHLKPIRLVIILNSGHIVSGDMWKSIFYIAGGNVNGHCSFGKQSGNIY